VLKYLVVSKIILIFALFFETTENIKNIPIPLNARDTLK